MTDKFWNKFFSARFLTTVLIITTFCYVQIACVTMVTIGKMSLEVFLGVFSSFSGLATMIVKLYFDRDDRSNKPPTIPPTNGGTP